MKIMTINLQQSQLFNGWWTRPGNVEFLNTPGRVSEWVTDRNTLTKYNKDLLPSEQVEIVTELENAQCVVLCSGICACCGDTGGEFLTVAKEIWATNPEMKIVAVCAVIENVGRWDWIYKTLEGTGIQIYGCRPPFYHPGHDVESVLDCCRASCE